MNEILYADDLILMNEKTKNLSEKVMKSKLAFENKGLKASPGKTKVMVSYPKREITNSKVNLWFNPHFTGWNGEAAHPACSKR